MFQVSQAADIFQRVMDLHNIANIGMSGMAHEALGRGHSPPFILRWVPLCTVVEPHAYRRSKCEEITYVQLSKTSNQSGQLQMKGQRALPHCTGFNGDIGQRYVLRHFEVACVCNLDRATRCLRAVHFRERESERVGNDTLRRVYFACIVGREHYGTSMKRRWMT
jgi:hypothetical protein